MTNQCCLDFVSFFVQINIEERNDDNYLSAGDIPIPILFFILSIVFFIAGIIWMIILRRVKYEFIFL